MARSTVSYPFQLCHFAESFDTRLTLAVSNLKPFEGEASLREGFAIGFCRGYRPSFRILKNIDVTIGAALRRKRVVRPPAT